MRTKTLIITAALGAAGLSTSMAQVFSVNAVGFVNKPISPGFNIIGNPLNNGDNSLAVLFPTVPDGTTIYQFSAGIFNHISTYGLQDDGSHSWGADATTKLNPGEGVFMLNPGTSNIVVTFVGEVPQGTQSNPLVAGFNLKSSIIPQSGQLDGTNSAAGQLAFPVTPGDAVYFYDPVGKKYLAPFNYGPLDAGGFGWDSLPAVPTPGVAEGFFVKTGTARAWTRTFDVNNP